MKHREWGWFDRFSLKRRRLPNAIAVYLLLLISGAAYSAQELPVIIKSADFLLSEAVLPPADSADWRVVSLPDNWNYSHPNKSGFGWYRFRFELSSHDDQGVALYLPRISMNAAYYINGGFLASGGSFEEPVTRNWNRAQFYVVAPALIKPGTNTIHLRLFAYANTGGGISQAFVGPEHTLRPLYERRFLFQTILPQISNILGVALGVFVLLLWTRNNADSVHFYFCLLALIWAARGTYLFVRDIPVSAFYWELFTLSSLGVCAVLGVFMMMRYSGWRLLRLEQAMWIYLLAGPPLMWVAGPQRLYTVASLWVVPTVIGMVFFAGVMTREAWRRRTTESALLAAAWLILAGLSCRDTAMRLNILPFDALYYVSYGMASLYLVMAWLLTNRFNHALDVSKRLNVELEQRVAEKHKELAQNFLRLQEMERQSAIADEQRRLMGEMHDGIGSQLMAALDAVEHGEASRIEIAEELRECMDSLRLTIDSLAPSERDLLTVLANLRYRLEGRLKRQGITLDWRVRDVPLLDSLTPHNVLHILRILQEAFTNIVKHARAKTITVETGVVDDSVFIRISDDGRGIVEPREGRGMDSMRRRALALKSKLEVNTSSSGTTLCLSLPLSD